MIYISFCIEFQGESKSEHDIAIFGVDYTKNGNIDDLCDI